MLERHEFCVLINETVSSWPATYLSAFMADQISQAVWLNKQLELIIQGRTALARKNSSLFLEAIYTTAEKVTCISKITASEQGLNCLCTSLHSDLSLNLLNGYAAHLIEYISAAELQQIGEGGFLQKVLSSILELPTLWEAFIAVFQAHQLQPGAEFGFAWLLLHLISIPIHSASKYHELG
jgi:hypothetical protein